MAPATSSSIPWPSPSTHPGLFSRDPEERIRSSNASQSWPSVRWPYGNQGAANAWLVLVGPSPGSEKRADVPPWIEVTFGDCVQHIAMHDTRGKAWDAVITAAFGRLHSPAARRQLVALINLMGTNATEEKKLDAKDLDGGVSAVVEKLRLVHPRVVLALSNGVYDRLAQALNTNPLGGDGALHGPYGFPLRAATFKDEAAGFDVLLIKGVQHPSRPVRRPAHLPDASRTELLTFGVCGTVNRFLHLSP
jgi:hypothetical protein